MKSFWKGYFLTYVVIGAIYMVIVLVYAGLLK